MVDGVEEIQGERGLVSPWGDAVGSSCWRLRHVALLGPKRFVLLCLLSGRHLLVQS
jgi:hypothetical protein